MLDCVTHNCIVLDYVIPTYKIYDANINFK